MNRLLLILSSFIAYLAATAHLAFAAPLRWVTVESGLEVSLLSPGDTISALETPIRLARVTPSLQRVQVVRALEYGQRRSSAKEVCRRMNASLCVNGSFFDEHGEALGLLISRGAVLQKPHQGGRTLTGIFAAGPDGLFIMHRKDLKLGSVLEGIQAGPRLIAQGKAVEGIDDKAPSARSGICLDDDGRLVVAVSPQGWRGLTLKQFQALLELPQLGCVEALNLDGGKSTQLFLNRQTPGDSAPQDRFDVQGFDTVPVLLAISPRQ